MARKKTYQNLYVGLTQPDQQRLAKLAEIDQKTKTELAREAVFWYLEQRENEQNVDRDSLYAKAIKEMTNRICGMLARQAAEIGTLYELTWRACGTSEAREEFRGAANTAKQRQRARLDKDEQALVEQLKKVVIE